ncbi:MAG: IS200/IS605 family element transposase accessory protein TnpB [Burkholderiales bacterium]|nr:IS200/IS605 family element transposase accessory protein TnpB [Anaerolineae bacterium]
MKLIAQLKLQPTPEQHALLKQTLETANAACNYASAVAWEQQVFGQFALQKLCYKAIRQQFDLGADVVVRVFAKVADAYKLDNQTKRGFKPLAAFPFNERLVSYKLTPQVVSIWTMGGRQKMPFVCGEQQLALLQGLRGECDLVYRKDEFYLFQTCDVEEAPEIEADEFLGIDMGIANIAVDSDTTFHQGKGIKHVRYRHRALREKLQAKHTDSARRKLKRLSGQERRYATNVNHVIAKQIVKTAQDTGRGIALENLKGIRKRVTARRGQRTVLHSWSFGQLRSFMEYKAKRVGVCCKAVDPRNTSRTCPNPDCRHVDKANRKTQDQFLCIRCGRAGHADYFAALEIRRRAEVNPPNVGTSA